MEPDHHSFALRWLTNGQNATEAYARTHPLCLSYNAQAIGGHRLLRNVKVRAFLGERLDGYWRARQKTADEVLASIADDIDADAAELLDYQGKLKPPGDWPVHVRNSIESVDFARGKVKLVSKLAAKRVLLEASGRLKSDTAASVDALADLIRADREKHAARKA